MVESKEKAEPPMMPKSAADAWEEGRASGRAREQREDSGRTVLNELKAHRVLVLGRTVCPADNQENVWNTEKTEMKAQPKLQSWKSSTDRCSQRP